MHRSVVWVLLVEITLILFTIILLLRPPFLFKSESSRSKTLAQVGGLFFLLITFLWSIVVGMILVVNPLSLKI